MLRNHFKGGRREPQRVVKDSQGNILTDRTAVLSRYREGMMAKTNIDVAAGVLGERDPTSEKERTGAWRRIRAEAAIAPPPKIQARDVDAAIKYIRRAKKGAPGRDGLPGWLYCLLDYAQLRATMKKILQIVTYAGLPPVAWAELRVVPVFKDGDSLDVRRYRPITLLVVLAKAVESVIKALAERKRQKPLHPSVMGFTKGRGRELAIFNLVETVLYRPFANRNGPAKPTHVYAALG